jgi:hypothetical protein
MAAYNQTWENRKKAQAKKPVTKPVAKKKKSKE